MVGARLTPCKPFQSERAVRSMVNCGAGAGRGRCPARELTLRQLEGSLSYSRYGALT